MSERMRLLQLLRERHDLLRDVRDALRRMDPAWCDLNGETQLSDEEFDEAMSTLEDLLEREP